MVCMLLFGSIVRSLVFLLTKLIVYLLCEYRTWSLWFVHHKSVFVLVYYVYSYCHAVICRIDLNLV